MQPDILHIYQNHHLDSLRWERFVQRDDDIVISTSYKSGTTLTQEIVRQLLFWNQERSTVYETPLWAMSPWLDNRLRPIDDVLNGLAAQKHRRFIKTHLALDGLPFSSQIKYVIVGRDPRDVFMSFWNHYSSYSDVAYEQYNDTPGRVGPPLPQCPADLHELWRNWITRGWFAWEHEGYPFWGNMHHVQSWWNYRHLDNIHFVHYGDLLSDLPDEIRCLADFLEIAISDAAIVDILPTLSLDAMRRDADRTNPRFQQIWEGGAQTFFFKGTNGRWKQVLSSEELALYEKTAARVLTPECRHWLEQGRVALAMQ
jgi:aryl sulfotransferase